MEDSLSACKEKEAAAPPVSDADTVDFQPPPYSAYPSEPPSYTPGLGNLPIGPRMQGYTIMHNECEISTDITVIGSSSEPDYMGLSIFTLLCCCLPLGIAALVYSVKTRECNKHGEVFAAQRNSLMAKKMNMWALGIGICLLLVYVPLKVYLFVMQSRSYSYSKLDIFPSAALQSVPGTVASGLQ
ncbi:interferon-induced transmembrane protein 2 [Microcaecilia unicolor]|uniref:Interferon-induced transmembrane protein 2-like n=1 Tax=Microcaecilia unicolor TaxID=1415580 RepID=A0A6P7YZQ0_9AMPH|nr:interferon-induced transmembrane protein 2-like [Microcaecilia unicolor]